MDKKGHRTEFEQCDIEQCVSFRVILSLRASQVVQTVKNLPAMQETWVQSLGQQDPLEKGMATHSSMLACRIP